MAWPKQALGYFLLRRGFFQVISNKGYIAMKKMIAYCGLDCEKCDAYLATIHNDPALREKTAKL